MNNLLDTQLNTEQDQIEPVRPEQKTAADVSLVELGKVSDTSGGFFGMKVDVGSGFITY